MQATAPNPRARLVRRLTGAALSTAMIPAILLGGTSSAAPTFADPVRVSGARGFEQGINVMADGTVFIDEPAGLGAHSNLWRSDDGGATFTKLGFGTPWQRLPGGGDSDVVVTDDGRVYFLDLWVGSNSIAVSEDKGQTWTIGTPFTTLPLTDRQWIALGKRDPATGKDTVYVVYQQFQAPNWVMLSRSRDGGLTWDFHRPVPFLTGGVSGSTGKLVADGDYVAFTYDQRGLMHAAYSTNAGEDWTSTAISLFNDADNNITGTALAGNYLYSAWVNPNSYKIKFSASDDRGATWSYPAEISAGGGSAVYSWVAARGSKVAVAWYETPATGGPDNVPSTALWTVKYAESLDRGVTWTTPVAVTGDVKRGPICTNGLGCNSGREVGDFLTLTITHAGKSMITYYDAVCGDGGPCSGGTVVKQS